jgi:poly(3-hydroxybutyrate) depolymerase
MRPALHCAARMRIALTAPLLLAILLGGIGLTAAYGADRITREAITIGSQTRHYYLLIPESSGTDAAPLLIVLHGSGRDGRSLVEPWRDLAAKEHIIVAGPDATERGGWQVPEDGPAFLYFLVEAVKAKHPIDVRRMYLFGHSAGAGFALVMGLMESQYFAAVAIHSGALQHASRDQLLNAPRKIPFLLFHGTADTTIPIGDGREARDALVARGFPARLTEMVGHDHNYYQRAAEINAQAWAFLQAIALDQDPQYQLYNYAR